MWTVSSNELYATEIGIFDKYMTHKDLFYVRSEHPFVDGSRRKCTLCNDSSENVITIF